jgi:RNA polymerase sigma factor (sigma-70 family)
MKNWRKHKDFMKYENADGSFVYIITVNGTNVEVSEEVYEEYARSSRKAEYIERDLKRNRVLKDAATGNTLKDENGFPIMLPEREVSLEKLMDEGQQFPDDVCIEDTVIKKMEFDELHRCLDLLSEDERALIQALFFDEMTEREYSRKSGIAQKTINDRKHKIFVKLKFFLQN